MVSGDNEVSTQENSPLVDLPEMNPVPVLAPRNAGNGGDQGLDFGFRRAREHQQADGATDLGEGQIEMSMAMPMVIVGSTHRMS